MALTTSYNCDNSDFVKATLFQSII